MGCKLKSTAINITKYSLWMLIVQIYFILSFLLNRRGKYNWSPNSDLREYFTEYQLYVDSMVGMKTCHYLF